MEVNACEISYGDWLTGRVAKGGLICHDLIPWGGYCFSAVLL